MHCFEWEKVYSKRLGMINIPVAEISIMDSRKKWKIIKVIVDSGATISLFKRSFGELLGIDIENGKKVTLGGIGEGKIEAYVHLVELKVGDFNLTASVAFANNDIPPNLLGRLNIFDNLEIQFKNVSEQTCFLNPEVLKG